MSKSFAAFTLVQNELVFAPIWASYYVPLFGPENVYVIDHGSSGDALESLWMLRREYGFQYLRIEYPLSFDDVWLVQTARSFHQFLLGSYTAVLFAGADEIVAPSPATAADLREYLIKRQPDVVLRRCYGVEVVHTDDEPDLRMDAGLLAQRQWCYPCYRYSKPVVGSMPILWNAGFSTAANVANHASSIDPDLWLFHLHRIDAKICLERHRERALREWPAGARQRPPYYHNVITEADRLRAWFTWHADDTSQYAQFQRLPEWAEATI